ncbi:MAG TPA: cob(I)yrinic acid a,c-diamide adenosyltransferase [Clostridia bacterium]|jgi:cob(I)alamin adenosyltransferase|nr:MAG: Cob(I)yrinic acid a,c-diamide adenosyltransferase [Firmicutes bacterium ADurb.Bin146]HOD92977.1 cob(I)yrinic acid a,c-diamide adenosyltransferase [Clostridia bacterium]HQM39251.1 cob(I)yrinic acid a,c-diamide adenosyltransferase [Clostridia bacterium]
MKGLIQVYTGDGKGKTTACVGAAIRAAGQGMKVYFVQFQKGYESGELNVLRKIGNINVNRICSFRKFYYNMDDEEKSLYSKEHKQAFNSVKEMVMKEPLDYDMLILDEIIGAVSLGVIEEDTLIDFLKSKPLHMEILLSGRNASNKIIEIADYVSEIKCIKHPFEHSIAARKGIEY